MAKKSKENMKEQYVFSDYAYAESVRNRTKEKCTMINKSMLISIVVTVLTWALIIGMKPITSAVQGLPLEASALDKLSGGLSWFFDFASIFLAGCSLAIYALAGALPEAVKIIHLCGKAGWYITPFFFFDILMYLLGAVLGIAIVLLVPCLTMLLCRSRIKKENAAAEEYMRCFIPANVVVNGED